MIKIVDITTGETIRTLNSEVFSLAVLTDGNLASGTADGEIEIWDPMTGLLIRSFKVSTDSLSRLAALSNGYIAKIVDDEGEDEVEIWDPWTEKL